jgi:hypothetical protein
MVDALALRRPRAPRRCAEDAVREERDDILHPIVVGGEDSKRIEDQIGWSCWSR